MQQNKDRKTINSSKNIKKYLNKSMDSIETINYKSHRNIDHTKEIFLVKKEIFNYEDIDILSKESNNVETYINQIENKEDTSKQIIIGLGLTIISFSTFLFKKCNNFI